ncbi:helix-turn-helix domain-containing protein [Pontibacter sp. BAB1700]|uniref:AlbA family DNA-binding domain-containing protein n=1 Tax=Pontibacter sp. BAB1700 TaxID=1144253 RepID=UPI00026BE175|nr:ATP-binding protein [Pontibacter sp. BAB1700]EJF08336.1 putative transcriptional regulator with HTH domain [Pontibacter sp. BAB1700]
MDDLQRLIWQGENDQVDFKQRVTQPDKIARTLVSFANTRGGTILIGVKDNGYIVGIDPDEEKHTLELAAAFYCNPPLQLTYEEVELDGHTILKVSIPESDQKPHFAKVKEDDWRGYVRVNDTSVQTSKMVEKSMQTEEPAFERIPLDRHERAVLDYLALNRRVTLRQYMKIANLSERRLIGC